MQYNKIDGLLRGGQDERQVVRAVSELWQFPAIVRLFHLSSEGGCEKLNLCIYIDFLAFGQLRGCRTERWFYKSSRGGKYTTWKSWSEKLFGFSFGGPIEKLHSFTKSSETV